MLGAAPAPRRSPWAFVLAVAISIWCVTATPAQAQILINEDDGEPDMLTFGAGVFDVLQQKYTAGLFNLEYRSGQRYLFLRPHVGMFATSDGGFYGYAGVRFDAFIGKRIVISPNFSPGLYHEGTGRDLGFVVEFRSGIEVGYRFNDRSRLTAALHHLSNASLGNTNPGTETVTLYYSMSLDTLLGRNRD